MSFSSGEALRIYFFWWIMLLQWKCIQRQSWGQKRHKYTLGTHSSLICTKKKKISLIHVSSNIYLYKMEQSYSRGRRKWVTWHFLNQMYVVKRFTTNEKKPHKAWFCRLLEWKDSWDIIIWALNHVPLPLIFRNQISPLFLPDLPISLTILSVSSTPTGSLNECRRGGNVFIWLPYIFQLL